IDKVLEYFINNGLVDVNKKFQKANSVPTICFLKFFVYINQSIIDKVLEYFINNGLVDVNKKFQKANS
ncbi:T3SS effector OspC family protein, partial [Shigella flexneri]|nr:T3SS effector OspC family protein [Shigella flexneri]